jgi:hypothetical protein
MAPLEQSRGSSIGENRLKSTVQDRLIALLEYIEQAEKLGRKPVFVVPDQFYCAYEQDLRGLPGVEFNLAVKADELWLRVPRLKEEEGPQPSEELKPWIFRSKDPHREPTLKDEITVPWQESKNQPQVLKRTDFPQIDIAFQAYLSGPWTAWSNYEVPRRKTIVVYNRLFSIQQAMETEGAETPLELVWGVGIALWKHASGQHIIHPILAQLVDITLDTRSLALEVRPRDLLPVLETDQFAVLDVPGVVQLETAWRAYLDRAEITLSPFDQKSFESLLRASVGFLDPSGCYWPEVRKNLEDRSLPEKTDNLTVTDTWVLYARKRSPNFLIEDIQRLKKNLESVKAVPGGPAALVSEPAGEVNVPTPVFFRGLSFSGGELPAGATPKELYFPKPYNEEQVSIVQKLEDTYGVVVQGPPGTGKTHTIANVICHYLANGKRVLVTSKGEPALAVLREQVPESVRALTVALLTDEKDGLRQFEHAIQVIAATVSRINPTEVERDVRSLSRRIDELHARLAETDREISRWAGYHLKRVRFQDREILPEELARHVIERQKDHDWLPDRLGNQSIKLQLSHSDITSVRKARLALGRDLAYLGIDLPAADSFPDGSTIGRLHEDLVRARRVSTEMQADGVPPLANSQTDMLNQVQALYALVQEALDLIERLTVPARLARHPSTKAIALRTSVFSRTSMVC